MNSFKTEGIVVRRHNFGEADRILTIFTKKHGKLKVIAKGVRRIQSRRGPNIELFNRATFFIHKGRSLDIVTEVSVERTYERIRGNLELIGLAYYVCELIDSFCAENQSHPNVYNLLIATLEELDKGIIERFETELLLELGFLPRNRIAPTLNMQAYIEQLLERKLKTKRILSKFS